jgi:hypothetical protein
MKTCVYIRSNTLKNLEKTLPERCIERGCKGWFEDHEVIVCKEFVDRDLLYERIRKRETKE